MPRGALLLAAALVVGSSAAACSIVVESQDRQCDRDEDCTAFTDAVCDVAGGVCVDRQAGCLGPDGCFSCAPTEQIEFLTACTDAECIPYDNAQLEGLLLEDGSLPPVP